MFSDRKTFTVFFDPFEHKKYRGVEHRIQAIRTLLVKQTSFLCVKGGEETFMGSKKKKDLDVLK